MAPRLSRSRKNSVTFLSIVADHKKVSSTRAAGPRNHEPSGERVLLNGSRSLGVERRGISLPTKFNEEIFSGEFLVSLEEFEQGVFHLLQNCLLGDACFGIVHSFGFHQEFELNPLTIGEDLDELF